QLGHHRPFGLPLSLAISSCHSRALAAVSGATPAALSPSTRKMTPPSGLTTISIALGSRPPSRAIFSARMPSLRLKELLPRLATIPSLMVYGVCRTQANLPFGDISAHLERRHDVRKAKCHVATPDDSRGILCRRNSEETSIKSAQSIDWGPR